MKPTTVISVRGRNRDELLADPDFVYVGRSVRWTEWTASIWGNPFTAGEYPGEDAVDRYRRYILASPELMARLGELRGKTLGCWCGDFDGFGDLFGEPGFRCHALVLAELADSWEPSS